MAKKTNLTMILIIIGFVLFFMMQGKNTTFLGSLADVSSATITRNIPDTVKAGNTFDSNYFVAGVGPGSWGVLVEDAVVSGSCTPVDINLGWTSPLGSQVKTMQAPSTAGTCQFDGTYIFAGDVDNQIISAGGVNTVNICVDECAAGDTGCTGNNEAFTCNVGAVCNTKIITVCDNGFVCSIDTCVADCTTLSNDAIGAITTWVNNPTTDNRNNALNSILAWASEC